MPTYTFRNKNTNEEWTTIMSLSEREQFLKENPHVEQLITQAPGLIDVWHTGRIKPTSATNEVLKRIKKNNYGSKINTGNLTEV